MSSELAHSRASSPGRQWTDPLIFTAPGWAASKPNGQIDTSISRDNSWSYLAAAAYGMLRSCHSKYAHGCFCSSFTDWQIRPLEAKGSSSWLAFYFVALRPFFRHAHMWPYTESQSGSRRPLKPRHDERPPSSPSATQSNLTAGCSALMRDYLKSVNMAPIRSVVTLCTHEYRPWRHGFL